MSSLFSFSSCQSKQDYILNNCLYCSAHLECYVDHKLGQVYNLCEIDKNSYYCLDYEKYLIEELGVLPTENSMKIIDSFNEKMAILDLLAKHSWEKHQLFFDTYFYRVMDKMKLKAYLNKKGLLIPYKRVIENDDGHINYNPVKSKISDCNYFINPINSTAAKILNCFTC